MSSLGRAIFGQGHGDTDTTQQEPCMPGLWLYTFLQQHTDLASRLALFQTTKGSWRWVLEDWEQLTVTLGLDSDPSIADRLFRGTQAVRHALKAHDDQPVLLRLQQDDPDQHGLFLTAGTLRYTGASVQELHISAPVVSEAAMQGLGRSLSSVHTLNLHRQQQGSTPAKTTQFSLPKDPSALPALRSLHLSSLSKDQGAASLASVRPYLTQLTKLQVTNSPQTTATDLTSMFCNHPSDTTWVLKYLDLHLCLSDSILTALVEHAVALDILFVPYIYLNSNHSHLRWLLKHLHLTQATEYNMYQIGHLPQSPPDKRLTVHADASRMLGIYVSSEADDVPWVTRVTDFTYAGLDKVYIESQVEPEEDGGPGEAEEHALLEVVLPAVAPLASKERTLQVASFNMSSTLVRQLHRVSGWGRAELSDTRWEDEFLLPEPLPALDKVYVDWALGDAELGVALTSTAAVQELAVYSVELSSDQHAARVWPWQRLTSSQAVYITDVTRLPDPHTRQQPAELHCQLQDIVVTSTEAAQSLFNCLSPRLSHLLFSKATSVTVKAGATLTADDQPSALRTTLQLVRAMRGAKLSDIKLVAWTLSPAVMEELRGLPQWGGTITFDKPVWQQADSSQYQQLPGLIPASFTQWVFSDGYPDSVLKAVCLSVPANRTQQQPLTITIHTIDTALVTAIMKQLSTAHKHVILKNTAKV